jgi:hypothetical protein
MEDFPSDLIYQAFAKDAVGGVISKLEDNFEVTVLKSIPETVSRPARLADEFAYPLANLVADAAEDGHRRVGVSRA